MAAQLATGCCLLGFLSFGQQAAPDPPMKPGTLPTKDSQEKSNRILGVFPNYRTAPSPADYRPISAKQKLAIATQDSFDRGTVVLAAFTAGIGQWTNSSPSFGQGAAGYGRRFGTAYADYVIGNYMTEGLYPAFLHQDPRYFARGSGSGWSRVKYAVAQTFWVHSDSGRMQFNYSEILGNSTAVAISQAYYPDDRDASSALTKLATQIGIDMGSNILKEFSSDLNRKFFHRHRDDPSPAP